MAGAWQPYWQASHAYTLTAVVIPTIFGGFTWRCTTAGTTGGTEPVWPDPLISPTVSDGTVTWTVGTGFRQALQNGVAAIVQAFATANPTIIRAVKTVRPPSFETGELPLFYIGDMSETVATSQGVRQRQFDGFSGFLVDHLGGDPYYSNDRMNFAADVLADLFTFNPHAASGRSIFQHTGTRDAEFDTPVPAVGLEFLFTISTVQEGRS
jgi:hypothetical protein